MNSVPLSDKTTSKLYEQDFCLWLETTVQLLRERQLNQIDYENLIEEIQSMGRSEKNGLKSNLEKLLLHLLKWRYQPSKRSNSWKYSITEHCLRLLEAFEDSPSLRGYFEEVFDKCYQNARLLASRETGLSKEVFPADCPFLVENILNPEYIPDDNEQK